MNWIDIAWPMMGAVSLTLGLTNLLIWTRQPARHVHLVLAFAALSAAVVTVLEWLLLRSLSPAEYTVLLRWAQVPVTILIVSLVAFVTLDQRAGRPWLAIAACALRVAALVAAFTTGENLNFNHIDALIPMQSLGSVVSVPHGTPNPWNILGQLSSLFLLLFMLDVLATVWRRGDPAARRRAVFVCGSVAAFVLLGTSWTYLVVHGIVHGPMSISVAFFAVVLVMSYELGGDVLRASSLSHRLAEREIELRSSEQRMQLAARAASLGLWSLDMASDAFWFDDSARNLLGYGAVEEIDRAALLARTHPEDQDNFARARQEAIQGGGDYSNDFRLALPAEQLRWLVARGRVEYSPAGVPLAIRGVIIDVTERRMAEARFRHVVESAPTAMLMADAQGRISLVNARAERVFHASRDALLGTAIGNLLEDWPAPGADDAQDVLSGTRKLRIGRRLDGTQVPVEVSVTELQTDAGPCMLASVTDVSERLRLEHEGALQAAELAHLSRVTLLGEMSGSLAHELNQPLTAILSNAQAALRFLAHSPPQLQDVRESLEHIVENDKRASDVIRRLRTMLRKEALEHRPLAVNDLVQDVFRLIGNDLMTRRVIVRTELGRDLPEVNGDRVQLQQVLLNLAMNSCDAMAAVAGSRVLVVRTLAAPGGLEISIGDNGSGIADGELERIFAPFVTSKPDGIGLGLAICRTIVQSHHGALWATNNDTRGATFHIELPSAP